jgi:hypothetical protein
MKGTGGGNFSPLDSNTASMPTTYGVVTQVMVDSNNDGRMEIAAGIGCNGGSTGPVFNYSDTSANGLFTGWGTRGTVPTGQPYYGSTTAMAVGDFLGVGTQSLVTLHSGSPGYSNYQVYQLHSGSQLNSVTTFTTPALVGKAACAIDADFDAKIDWAISYKDSLIRVYRGSTQGQVAALDAAAGSPSISSPKTGFMAPGDVDGDGKPDIVCTTSYFAIEGMASIYGSTYSHQTPGNGSSMGIVFFLNTSN